MLAERKREFELYYEEEVQVSSIDTKLKVKTNVELRNKCLILVSLILFLAMVTMVRSEMVIRNGYELVELKGQVNKLDQDNERLKLDIAKLKSPERIQTIAVGKLGMTIPQNVYFVNTNS